MSVEVASRDLDLLRPDFRGNLERYFAAVKQHFPQYGIGVHETYRSPERQRWLFEQGRSRPGIVKTWTLDSNHQYGIAADWHLLQDNFAVWDSQIYASIYEVLPPHEYGLESLAPAEYVHLQLFNANENRVAEAPGDTGLLLVFDENNQEVLRLEVPEGGSIIDRQRGSRRYIRVAGPE